MGRSCICTQKDSLLNSILEAGEHPSKGFRERREDSKSQGLQSMTHFKSPEVVKEKMKIFELTSMIEKGFLVFHIFDIVFLIKSLMIDRSTCNLPIMLFYPILISVCCLFSSTKISLSSSLVSLSCFHLLFKLFIALTFTWGGRWEGNPTLLKRVVENKLLLVYSERAREETAIGLVTNLLLQSNRF